MLSSPQAPDGSPSPPAGDRSSPEERLESWKAIASYLRRDARTAQRWEKTEGLPVYRLPNAKRGGVFAYRHEIDAWWNRRRTSLQAEADLLPELAITELPGGAPVRRVQRNNKFFLVTGAFCLLAGILLTSALRDRLFRRPSVVTFVDYPGYSGMGSFSPDGKSVAFVWNRPGESNEDIYIRDIASGALQSFVTSPEDDFSPAWSPDGRNIAFLRKPRNANTVSIFLQQATGGDARRLLVVPQFNENSLASLCWTNDSQWLIAAAQEIAAEPVGLFLISPVDGRKTRLTLPPAGQMDLEPAISPDGSRLAFIRVHGQSVTSVFVVPLTRDYHSSAEPRLVPTFSNLRVGSPQWSADGRSLMFVGQNAAVWKISVPAGGAAGGAPQRLPFADRSTRSWISRPDYARNRLMVGISRDEISVRRVSLNPERSGEAPQIVGSATDGNSAAQISPDRKKIAFETTASGTHEIGVANVDGSNARVLTSFGGPNTGSPSWSPDSQWLAFDSRTEGHPHVYLISVAGGSSTRITTALANNNVPSWSRDGKWIYYVSTRSGPRRIWRQPVAGGDAEQINEEDAWGPVEAPDPRGCSIKPSRIMGTPSTGSTIAAGKSAQSSGG